MLPGAGPGDDQPAAREDYTAALKADALKSARIGVPRAQYFGYNAPADAAVDAAIAVMKAQGATIVDPADIPTAARLDACEIEVLSRPSGAATSRHK